MKNCCIILAAGDGKRMKSAKPKVLAEVLFEPLLGWVLDSVEKSETVSENAIGVIVGNGAESVKSYLSERGNYNTFLQAERKGTGHAVMQGLPMIEEAAKAGGDALVLCGDAPFIDSDTIKSALKTHIESDNDVTVITAETEPFGYGRIIRNGERLSAIVEEKDCTDEQRKIREINSGAYWFKASALKKALPLLGTANASGEYYLTDAIGILSKKAGCCKTENSDIALGANTREQLYRLNEQAKTVVMKKLMQGGVEFIGESYIGKDVEIGADTVVLPNTIIKGKTKIGTGCKIGPNSCIESCIIGDNNILDNVKATNSVTESNVKAGPFVQLRSGTKLLSGVKIGDFVEIKNSEIGGNTCIAHLTYLGDSDVGRGVNFGCGCVTANYDGINKFRTKIGDNAFIGCNTNLIAPVEVGENATTAAGSTICENVPANSLAVERGSLKIKENWEKNGKRIKKG